MKKILFTCGAMTIGGVQKSLISLLNSIDKSKYNIYLLLQDIKGELVDDLPPHVIVLKGPEIISKPTYSKDKIISEIFEITFKNPSNLKKYFNAIPSAIRYGSKHARQIFWDNIKSEIDLSDELNIGFDVAISYAGGIGIWNQLIIDKINAKKKICWIHGDYSVFGTRTELEKGYMKKFDTLVAVSETAEKILLREIPELKGRTTVIHNIIDKGYIHDMADKENVYDNTYSGIRFISISRLDKGKGFDLAIRAFSRAIHDGYDLKWDIIGDGHEREVLFNLINKLGLSDRVHLLGKRLNPYPYLRGADVFIHPSKGEGKSMSVDEAKLMGKPILITEYPTVRDQIEDGITGKIVPISEEGIYRGIIEMALNSELRSNLTNNLKNFNIDTNSVEKYTSIIE